MKTFQSLGVREDLLPALKELGIIRPTPVQQEVIPLLLGDPGGLIVQAQTGTGKTAAFGLPLLMGINPAFRGVQALVIAPTRELARQIGRQLFKFTKFSPDRIFTEVVTGGDSLDRQAESLRRPTHIVVATPGRLLDLLERGALSLGGVRTLVLDEADEMLTLGFRREVGEICLRTAGTCGALWLFSATIPEGLKKLIAGHLPPETRTVRIDETHVVNRDIAHRFLVVREKEKTARIVEFLNRQGDSPGIIFCRTRAEAAALAEELKSLGCPVGLLQGQLAQAERDKVLRSFRKGRFQFLVSTDVAARGIDVGGLAFVLHHQLPDQMDQYTHRSGRTGRAGNKGISVAFIGHAEKPFLTALSRRLGIRFTEYS